jgi:SAM-dependent methyltransferase
MEQADLDMLATQTQMVYERNGARYNAERAKMLFERPWLSRFEELLPNPADILDVGCGAAEPIAQYFLTKGHAVTGIDFAQSMLDLAKMRFPEATWIYADMRQLDLNQQFDGIIGWHSFFHLKPNEQRRTLIRFAEHLKPSGALLITVGTTEAETIGRVGDDWVYHASLAPEEYRDLLSKLGLEVIDFVFEDPQCNFATILLAKKVEEIA